MKKHEASSTTKNLAKLPTVIIVLLVWNKIIQIHKNILYNKITGITKKKIITKYKRLRKYNQALLSTNASLSILCPYNSKGYVTVSRVLGVVSQIHAEHLFADSRCITEYLSIYIAKYLRVERYTIWANRVPRRDLQLITLNLCSFMALDSPKYIYHVSGWSELEDSMIPTMD